MADRYTYIPLIGICLLLVWGLCELTKSWQFQTAVLAALTVISIAACIFLTRFQIGFWKDDITVWNRVIAATKDNYVAHDNLGAILYSTKPDLAFSHFQEATRINPNYVPALRNLAGVLYVEGRAGVAVLPALKAAELDPSGATSENALNSILFNSNNQSDAISNFLEAVRLEPRDFSNYLDVLLLDTNRVEFMNELAWIFATNPDPKLRNSQFAVRLAKRTCEITDFQVATYVRTLAAAYAADSRFGESASAFLKAAELNPSDAAIENELVSILLNKGYRSETVSNFLEAVRLEPRDFSNYLDVLLLDTNRVEFMNELAWIFATNPDPKLRNSQFAVRLAKRACELTNYKQTICVGTLAAAYAEAGQFDDAIVTAQKACDLATQHGEKDLLQKNQELLELYRAHKPIGKN
jgi:tetratricopeptide (TPR) repeat protein